MSEPIRFRVEGRPPTVNEMTKRTRHWGTAHLLKKAWADRVMVARQNNRLQRATGKRRVDIVVMLGKGQRTTDPDALWKSSLDALKVNWLLVDDSPKWCEMGTVTFKERGSFVEKVGWTEYILTETA